MKRHLTLLLIGWCIAATQAQADEATAIAGRALPYILEKGAAWIEDRECVSCHQVPAQLWSLRSAARAGLPVDLAQLAETMEWSVDWRNWNNPKAQATEDSDAAGNVDTLAALLMGRDREAQPQPPWVERLARHLIRVQNADGSWKPGGQRPLQKLPEREIGAITTMWAMLALESVEIEGATIMPALEKARTWLANAPAPAQGTEWHALRLLLDGSGKTKWRTVLLKWQQPSGGWGWVATEPADALATGLALYALARDGVPADDPAVARAITFLGRTQQPDGSWIVPSTRAKDKGKPIATSNYWGTAWAAIGLLEVQRATSTAVDPPP